MVQLVCVHARVLTRGGSFAMASWMNQWAATVVLVTGGVYTASALDNGVALTPPMGWNS